MPGDMSNRRPDLEALEVNPMFSYIGPRVLPVFNRTGKVGYQYYMTLPSDVAAQTGRSGGTAPTSTSNSASSTTFTAVERINRQYTADDEDALLGGVEAANRRMTITAKRSIMRANEDLVVAATLSSASITTADILASLRQAMDTAVDTIHRYPGRTLAAMGWTTFRRLTRYSEVTNTLLRTGIVASTAEAIRYVTPPTLATILGVDEVLVGDDDHWTAGKMLLFKEVNAAMSPQEDIQLGRLVQYLPDGQESPVVVEAFLDPVSKAYMVDARVWNVAKVFNTAAAYILAGIDEGNAITTTTTTTTTTT